MGRRDLLNDAERKILFGTAEAHDESVRRYTLSGVHPRSWTTGFRRTKPPAGRLAFRIPRADGIRAPSAVAWCCRRVR